jgi:hypothetical protein
MSKLIDPISKISNSSNCREVCGAPKESKETESTRLLCRSNIGVGTAEVGLEFALVKENSGARSRSCEEGLR